VITPEIFHPYRLVGIVPSPSKNPRQGQGMNGIMES
jgi:hypothetical protein